MRSFCWASSRGPLHFMRAFCGGIPQFQQTKPNISQWFPLVFHFSFSLLLPLPTSNCNLQLQETQPKTSSWTNSRVLVERDLTSLEAELLFHWLVSASICRLRTIRQIPSFTVPLVTILHRFLLNWLPRLLPFKMSTFQSTFQRYWSSVVHCLYLSN